MGGNCVLESFLHSMEILDDIITLNKCIASIEGVEKEEPFSVIDFN